MSLLPLLLIPALLSAATATGASASVCQRSTQVAQDLALESLLGDGRHPESPLALVRAEELADSELLKIVADARTRGLFEFRALEPSEHPEGGESSIENHLFIARIRTLSDHLFFVVVPRDCTREVYNYGFN